MINIKYSVGDEVITLLGDIGYIIEIIIQKERVRYTIWYGEDKYIQLSDRQIKPVIKKDLPTKIKKGEDSQWKK